MSGNPEMTPLSRQFKAVRLRGLIGAPSRPRLTVAGLFDNHDNPVTKSGVLNDLPMNMEETQDTASTDVKMSNTTPDTSRDVNDFSTFLDTGVGPSTPAEWMSSPVNTEEDTLMNSDTRKWLENHGRAPARARLPIVHTKKEIRRKAGPVIPLKFDASSHQEFDPENYTEYPGQKEKLDVWTNPASVLRRGDTTPRIMLKLQYGDIKAVLADITQWAKEKQNPKAYAHVCRELEEKIDIHAQTADWIFTQMSEEQLDELTSFSDWLTIVKHVRRMFLGSCGYRTRDGVRMVAEMWGRYGNVMEGTDNSRQCDHTEVGVYKKIAEEYSGVEWDANAASLLKMVAEGFTTRHLALKYGNAVQFDNEVPMEWPVQEDMSDDENESTKEYEKNNKDVEMLEQEDEKVGESDVVGGKRKRDVSPMEVDGDHEVERSGKRYKDRK